MKKTHFIKLNGSAEIIEYKLPFVLSNNCELSDLLPIYSYIDSYEHLINLEIDAYEFDYQGAKYIIDIILLEKGDEYIIYLEDKTDYYTSLAKDQTLHNTKKIELEYARLNQSFLVSKNKYLEFVINTMSDMLQTALDRINDSVLSLNTVNTYVKEDEKILSNTMEQVKNEIEFIKQTMAHMSIFNHLDPSSLLSNPEFIPLKRFIIDIAQDVDGLDSVITNEIPDSALLYGNRGFFTELLKYYLNRNMLQENNIEFRCNDDSENLLELNINYFANIKGFVKPQKFSQNILLPSSFEIESDTVLIEKVFNNIKNVLLNQAKILYEVAA